MGGRIGENASNKLAERLYELGIVTGRLKTGTPQGSLNLVLTGMKLHIKMLI